MLSVLGPGNSDFLLVSSSRSVGLSSAPIDFISRIPWWSALPRPEDALPPMAESQVRVVPRFTENGRIKTIDKFQRVGKRVKFNMQWGPKIVCGGVIIGEKSVTFS